MLCTQCKVEVVPEAAFCHRCGLQVGANEGDDTPIGRLWPNHGRPNPGRLDDDLPEQELWQGKFSKLAMIGSWLGAAAFSLAMLVLAVAGSFGGAGWLVSLGVILLVWLGLLGRLFYRQLDEHYYLTSQRFIHEKGLLWREINRVEAIDVDDVSFQQGPIERLVGIGTIRLRSSDESHPTIELPGIENARVVAEMIDEVRRQERVKRGLHVEAV